MSNTDIDYPSISIQSFEEFQNSVLNICINVINNYKSLLEIIPLNIDDLKKYQNKISRGKKKSKGITVILKELSKNVNRKWLSNKQLIYAIFSLENLYRKFFSSDKSQNDFIYNYVLLESINVNFFEEGSINQIIVSILKNINELRNSFKYKSSEKKLSFFSNSQSTHSICNCDDIEISQNISNIKNLSINEKLILQNKYIAMNKKYCEYKKMLKIVKSQYFSINNFLINIYLLATKDKNKEILNLFLAKRKKYAYIINSGDFLHACEIDDMEMIESLLKLQNIGLNHYYCNRNMFPLEYIFTSERNKPLFEKILSCPSFDINSKDDNGRSIIHKLFNVDMSSVIGKLILSQPYIDYNIQDNYGDTLLMQSIESDNIELTRYLLNQPLININLTNIYGECALALAIEYKREDAIDELLNCRDIDVNITDKNGISILMKAIKFSISKDYIKKLIDFPDIDLKIVDKKKRNLLFYIINYSCTEIIDYVINKKGYEININKNFSTKELPLNMAIKYSDKSIIKEILSLPSLDINKIDDKGRTPLMVAIENEDVESVKLLLENENIIVNKNDRFKRLPLNYATQHNLFNIVELLINHKDILINNKDNEGKTCLIRACLNDNVKIVNLILEKNADINLQDNYHYTALMYTIEQNYYKSFNALIGQENINFNIINDDHFNALQLAIITENVNMVEKLLEFPSIEINYVNNHQKSALILAVESKYCNDLADLLLTRPDIDINIKDEYNNTALSLSIELNKPTLTKKLLQYINNKKHLEHQKQTN